jgi:hypothetical protein
VDAPECQDTDYVDCEVEVDAPECQDTDYVDCEVEVDAPECQDTDYVDCEVEVDAPECEWLEEWDGEGDLPAWLAEDAIIIDCTVGMEQEECFWSDEDWYNQWGDGYLSYIDYEDGSYIIIFEPGRGDFGENFDDWVFEPDEGAEGSDADLTFGVDGSELTDPQAADGTVDPAELQNSSDIWGVVTQIVPGEWLSKISKFELFSTDDGTLAYVYPDENNPGKWVLGVNSSEATDKNALMETIIHELAHIVTLDPQQFDGTLASGGAASCSTINLEEGCALPNSYLNAFYTAFWAGIDAEYRQIEQLSGAAQEAALAAFYDKYRDQFVSDYATTNIAEDMAETFAAFVTRERPSGSSIADQKILFFYNFPELVALRDEIRSRMG